MNYTAEEKACIWLDLFDFLSLEKKTELLNHYKDFDTILENFQQDIPSLRVLIKNENLDNMLAYLDENILENRIKLYESKHIKCITRYSKLYPEKLQTIDPPIVIYAKGNLDLLNAEYSISIVGTRTPTKYGKAVTERFTRELVRNNFVIVSGMAYGIDSVAHNKCLENKGKTIAVLGGGFDHIYPTSNTELYNTILLNDGLVLTEYRPEVRPANYHFPRRNRIIVGVSKGVLITEASKKSGTNYTRDYAIESGTELMVVPGNIDNPYSEGCNYIIKNYPSTLVRNEDDILEVYNFKEEQKIKNETSYQLNFEEQCIINILGNEQKHYDELLMKTQFPSKILNVALTTLQLKGILKKSPGNLYEVIY